MSVVPWQKRWIRLLITLIRWISMKCSVMEISEEIVESKRRREANESE